MEKPRLRVDSQPHLARQAAQIHLGTQSPTVGQFLAAIDNAAACRRGVGCRHVGQGVFE